VLGLRQHPYFPAKKRLAHNNQPNHTLKNQIKKGEDWHDVVIDVIIIVIVIGGLDASLLLLFVTRRAFSHCCASFRCSIVSLNINIVSGFDVLSSLFVVPPCLLLLPPFLPRHCHCWS
jgi:hypothetical protein